MSLWEVAKRRVRKENIEEDAARKYRNTPEYELTAEMARIEEQIDNLRMKKWAIEKVLRDRK